MIGTANVSGLPPDEYTVNLTVPGYRNQGVTIVVTCDGQVLVKFTLVNDRSVGDDQALVTPQDTPLPITLTGSDPQR